MEAREGWVGKGEARRNWIKWVSRWYTKDCGHLEPGKANWREKPTNTPASEEWVPGSQLTSASGSRPTSTTYQHCQIRPTLNPQAGSLPLSSMTQRKNLPVLLGETLTSKRKMRSSRRD